MRKIQKFEDFINDQKMNEVVSNDNQDYEMVNEMAVSRETFRNKFGDILNVIYEHLMLVLYVKNYQPNNMLLTRNLNHWKKEVKTHLTKVTNYTITKNDSDKIRFRALMQELSDQELLYGNHDGYIHLVKNKFEEEHIDITDDEITTLDDVMMEDVWNNIVQYISKKDFDGIDEFINKL